MVKSISSGSVSVIKFPNGKKKTISTVRVNSKIPLRLFGQWLKVIAETAVFEGEMSLANKPVLYLLLSKYLSEPSESEIKDHHSHMVMFMKGKDPDYMYKQCLWDEKWHRLKQYDGQKVNIYRLLPVDDASSYYTWRKRPETM